MDNGETRSFRHFIHTWYQLGAYLLMIILFSVLFFQLKSEETVRTKTVAQSFCEGQQDRLALIKNIVITASMPPSPPINEQVDLSKLTPDERAAVDDLFNALQSHEDIRRNEILAVIAQADTCPESSTNPLDPE